MTMQEIFLDSGLMHKLWDASVSSRFDLIMFATGLILYIILCASRNLQRKVKDLSEEIDVTTEDFHVTNADQGLDMASSIRFYLENAEFEKACDVFELNYATFFDAELNGAVEWQLMMAALKCGRQSLAEHLLQTSESDKFSQVVSIQRWWRQTSGKMSEARVEHMGDVLNRLSNMFNERYPFEEHSDDESTCFLGDDSDCEDSDDPDYNCEEYTAKCIGL
jgi:hypothetical protein